MEVSQAVRGVGDLSKHFDDNGILGKTYQESSQFILGLDTFFYL